MPDKLVRKKICPLSGKIFNESCVGYLEEIFIEGTEPDEICSCQQKRKVLAGKEAYFHYPENPTTIRVSFPADGDVFKMDPILRQSYQAIRLKVSIRGMDIERIEWWVNNKRIGDSVFPFSFSWPLRPGFYTIKAKARKGNRELESQPVKIRIIS